MYDSEEDEIEHTQSMNKYHSSDDLHDSIADTSLPSHISEIEPPEPFDIDEYIKEVRHEYRNFNIPHKENRKALEKEDKNQYPLYARLNMLRKTRQDIANK